MDSQNLCLSWFRISLIGAENRYDDINSYYRSDYATLHNELKDNNNIIMLLSVFL